VIGVVKDFQTTTMEASIAPTVIRLEPEGTHTLWVRAEPGRIREALANLETVHKQFNPEYPFAYTFLDKTYETLYRDVLVMGNLASVFAVIAIFISCLGLFGLASFTAEQRTKEIGIRKVLGASVSGLALSFSLNFTRLVLLGIVLAMPVAYYVIHAWLARYQYHAELGIGIFILAGSAAVLIAWLTVGYQSIKAALADPVKSLRYE
jgi:ABC-type antimicrobial peptide transport system permease subunit